MQQGPVRTRGQVLPTLDDLVPAMKHGNENAHNDPKARETDLRKHGFGVRRQQAPNSVRSSADTNSCRQDALLLENRPLRSRGNSAYTW